MIYQLLLIVVVFCIACLSVPLTILVIVGDLANAGLEKLYKVLWLLGMWSAR